MSFPYYFVIAKQFIFNAKAHVDRYSSLEKHVVCANEHKLGKYQINYTNITTSVQMFLLYFHLPNLSNQIYFYLLKRNRAHKCHVYFKYQSVFSILTHCIHGKCCNTEEQFSC